MGDWDDDDFEVDVKQLDEKRHTVVDEEVGDKPEETQSIHATKLSSSKSAKKTNDPLNTLSADLSRELSGKEKEQLQRRADLMLAKDLFGIDDEEPLTYAELTSLDEFRTFGENIGRMLSARSNATHFSEMLVSLLRTVLSHMDASKARVLSTVVKTIADEKTAAEKAKAKGKGAAAKPTIKNSSKSNAASGKASKNLYDDYVADEYDDYADHFM